jgi:hypothetical protein
VSELEARLSPACRAAREEQSRRESARSRPYAERVATAAHEAGHAVVALAVGCDVRRVSIVGDGGQLEGFCDLLHARSVAGPSAARGGELVEELEHRAMILVAGAVAARKCRYDRTHELADAAPWEAEQTRDYLRRAHPYSVEETFRAITRRTEQLLAQPLERDRLLLLTHALVKHLELDEAEIVAAIEPAARMTDLEAIG